jgi:outer membrane lipoprotein-sorting protein
MQNRYTRLVEAPAKAYRVLIGRAKARSVRSRLQGHAAAAILLAPALLLGTAGARAGDDELAKSIVEKADHVRFPAEPFEVAITISTTNGSESAEERRYRVLAKGPENTIVMVTEPATERGQILLMKGRDLWIFLPTVSQPVRLSLAQRLTGQVANGDLARANFAGDYAAKLLRTEKSGNDTFYVLELTAIERSVTYHRVVYWVGESNFWPHKAEFYSLSDRLVKTCLYENYKLLAGRERPTRLVMRNALVKDEESVLEYSSMRVRDLPDRMFTKDYLKRLE